MTIIEILLSLEEAGSISEGAAEMLNYYFSESKYASIYSSIEINEFREYERGSLPEPFRSSFSRFQAMAIVRGGMEIEDRKQAISIYISLAMSYRNSKFKCKKGGA